MRHIPLLLIVPIVLTHLADARGVFVYKKQSFHQDKDAHAFEYTKVEVMPPIVWVTAGGKRIRFERTMFHLWLEYPNANPKSIATDSEINAYKGSHKLATEFYTRFPNTRPFLKEKLEAMQDALAKLNAGHVLYDNEWILRTEYENLLLKNRLEAERKASELEQARLKQEQAQLAAKKKQEELQRKEFELVTARREAIREKKMDRIEAQIQEKRIEIDDIKGNISLDAARINRLLP